MLISTTENTASSLEATIVSDSILELAAALPELTPLYADVTAPVALERLPILKKTHFRSVKDSLLNRAQKTETGGLILGSGGTTSEPLISVIPSGMFLPEITQIWRPLTKEDVVINLNVGRELGSMFPFFSALSHICNATTVPLGPLVDREAVVRWAPFLETIGTTALVGTPTQIGFVLETLMAEGLRLPALKKIVWTGEAFNEGTLAKVTRYGPLDLYGAYGSTETWVIGVSYPDMPIGTFRRVPYQHLEFVDGHVTVTCLDRTCINPILRYQPGDVGGFCESPCGRPDCFTIRGRADEQIKFISVLFYPREPYDTVMTHPNVDAAQVAIIDHGSPEETMDVRVRLTAAAADAKSRVAASEIRSYFLGKLYRLADETRDFPERVTVSVVDRLSTNQRTMKTPYLIYETTK